MYEQQYQDRPDRAAEQDSFLHAFGNKHGSNRRKERRVRKGWDERE